MKRAPILIAGVLAATLVLATACGGGEEAPPARPTATTAPAATRAPTPTAAPPAATAAPAAHITTAGAGLEISVNGDALVFDKNKLTAKAGSEVVLTLNNVSKVNQHNWVLVQAGTKDAVGEAGTAAGPGNEWVPPGDDRVIAHTKLLDAGATGEVSFTAPAPGTYQFVCTFPGHNITMFGDFVVTP